MEKSDIPGCMGANYHGKNKDEWFNPSLSGNSSNTNRQLMLGYTNYPLRNKTLFLETSVFCGVNTFWTGGHIQNDELQLNEKYSLKRHRLIGGAYGKLGYYIKDRVGLFANAMIPVWNTDQTYRVSYSKGAFDLNHELAMLFGIGVIVKPRK